MLVLTNKREQLFYRKHTYALKRFPNEETEESVLKVIYRHTKTNGVNKINTKMHAAS